MKKISALILTLVMVFSLAACGSEAQKPDSAPEVAVGSAEELLNSVWNSVSEDQKFPVMGGDMDNMQENMAGKFDMGNMDAVTSVLHISEETAASVSEAATLVHAMNANTFTGVAVKLNEGVNAEKFINAVKADVEGTQWMCGFPEYLVVYTLGDYVVYAIGAAELTTGVFKSAIESTYGEDAHLALEQPLS